MRTRLTQVITIVRYFCIQVPTSTEIRSPIELLSGSKSKHLSFPPTSPRKDMSEKREHVPLTMALDQMGCLFRDENSLSHKPEGVRLNQEYSGSDCLLFDNTFTFRNGSNERRHSPVHGSHDGTERRLHQNNESRTEPSPSSKEVETLHDGKRVFLKHIEWCFKSKSVVSKNR